MANARVLAIMAAIILLLMVPTAVLAQGQPPPPATWDGIATIDGEPAPDGTMVSAMVGDATDPTATGEVTGGAGAYFIIVAQPSGENFTGMDVHFMVGDAMAAEVGNWAGFGDNRDFALTGISGLIMVGVAASVEVGWVGLNQILVDSAGMTLYLFTNDEHDGETSACESEACAAAWPALTTDGDPVAGDGVDGDLLGSFERTDGTTQVSYHGWPLYNYTPDTAPGDTLGQGRGGIWWVVSPDGGEITGAAAEVDADAIAAAAANALKADAVLMALLAGSDGADGADGADGSAGGAGAQGSAGVAGAQGPAGADGAQGTAGSAGAAGATGEDGGGGALGVIALILAIVALVGVGGAFVMGRRS